MDDEITKWVPDTTFTADSEQLTVALLEAQQQYPLIEIAKSEFGITIGGVGLHFPFMLSAVHICLCDTQNYLLSQELASVEQQAH